MVKKLNLVANSVGAVLLAAVSFLVIGRYVGAISGPRATGVDAFFGAVERSIERPFKVAARKREYARYVPSDADEGLFGPATGGSVPVLVYHSIPDDGVAADWADVSRTQFKEQMFALKKAGYRTLSIEELRDFLYGKTKVDDRAVVLTFDDGIRTSYENTDDVLEALDFNAVMFVISGFSLEDDKSYYLHRDDLTRMLATGRWDIQSHGHESHFRRKTSEDGTSAPMLANKLWLEGEGRQETDAEFAARVTDDLVTAKARLQELTGQDVFAFAVPFNDFGQLESNYPDATARLLDAVWGSYDLLFYQFRSAVGGEFRSNFPSTTQGAKRAVMRIGMQRDVSTTEMLMRLAASERKTLPYTEDFSNPNSWVDAWSQHKTIEGGMEVGPSLTATSYFGYLDGSYDWTDYRVDASIEWIEGRSFSLLAHLKNAYEYLSCDFGDEAVQLRSSDRSQADGPVTLGERRFGVGPKSEPQHFSMGVGNGEASCWYEGRKVLSVRISDDADAYGGVALKTWDPVAGASKAIVRSFEVTPK